MLTLAERPHANGIVEWSGGEVMRHLRLLMASNDLRSLWSVMLPLAQRIINNTCKAAVGNTSHRLIQWSPTNLDRGLYTPIDEPKVVPPLFIHRFINLCMMTFTIYIFYEFLR